MVKFINFQIGSRSLPKLGYIFILSIPLIFAQHTPDMCPLSSDTLLVLTSSTFNWYKNEIIIFISKRNKEIFLPHYLCTIYSTTLLLLPHWLVFEVQNIYWGVSFIAWRRLSRTYWQFLEKTYVSRLLRYGVDGC